MPNLLPIHFKITQLRDFKDDAIYQAKSTRDDTRATLENHFTMMDDMIAEFENRLGILLVGMLDIVRAGNHSLVVRLVKIIEAEERSDEKIKALQDAQDTHGDLVARFKSIQVGTKEVRGYKQKFIDCVKASVENKFIEAEEAFEEDSSTLHDSFDWYFDDLDVVKHNLVRLTPPSWKIFEEYLGIYHGAMHIFLTNLISKEDLDGQGLLQIILWKSKYDAGLKSLKINKKDLVPQVLGGHDEDLVKEYLNIIVTKMAEWMKNVLDTDTKDFVNRTESPEVDENSRFILQGAVITFQMINQQIDVASDANKASVLVGVVDECVRLLKERQTHWEDMTRRELDKFIAQPDDVPGGILEWMCAAGNDQARCAIFTESVKSRLEPALPNKIKDQVNNSLESAIVGFLDTAGIIMSRITEMVFNDLRPAIATLFTPAWYGSRAMEQMTKTIAEYLSDCKEWVDDSIYDELVFELSDTTVINYLSAVRNKNVKFNVVSGDVAAQIRADVQTGFVFFAQHMSREQLKGRWMVIEYFLQLVTCRKEDLWETYKNFKTNYWDLSNDWVDMILRAREDSSREMLGIIKSKATELGSIEIGTPTIMSKVKGRRKFSV